MEIKSLSRTWLVLAFFVLFLSTATVGYAAVSQFEVGGGTAYGVDGGPEISVEPVTSVDSGNPVRSGSLVNISDVEFESSGDTTATVEMFGSSNAWTNLSNIDVTSSDLTVRVPNKQSTTIGGDLESISFTDVVVNDGSVDFVYAGSAGSTMVELEDVPSSMKIGAADVKNDVLLDVATSSSSGTVVISGLPNSEHKVRLETSSGGPTLSNGRPNGLLQNEPQELKVDLEDADMPHDEVNVSFRVDGNRLADTNLTSNGTATIDVSGQSFVGGQHTVEVTATDAYGQTDTLSWTFSAPDELQIKNESSPTQLVDQATVEVTFYFESGGEMVSQTKTTSNGKISLTGLPVDKPLVASAQANGFRDRRIFIESIYQQQNVYLLANSRQATQVTFQLKDFSGDFPESTTVLIVERTLENGTYKTVLGDFFGANGQFPAVLKYTERHRLTLLNTETGQTRDLGTFTPLSSGQQDLAVSVSGQIEPVNTGASLSTKPVAELLPAQEVTLEVKLRNGSAKVSEYNVTMYKITESGTNTTVAKITQTSAGTVTETVNLSDAANGTLKIVSKYKTENGAEARRVKTFGVIDRSGSNPTIVGELDSLVGLLPSSDRDPFSVALALVVSVMGTGAAASRFRLSSELVGVVAIGFLTAFGILGFVGYDLVFVVIVAWTSLTFLRRGL